MKNPDDRSPREWAEEAREQAVNARERGCNHFATWCLSLWDCEELAARMDDLEEALRLLRDDSVFWPEEDASSWVHQARALLARYEEDEQ